MEHQKASLSDTIPVRMSNLCRNKDVPIISLKSKKCITNIDNRKMKF